MLAGLLICAGAGAGLGLAGCRRRGARAWVVHATMAAAMLAMLVPGLDPFGAGGWLVWAGALACLAIWTSCAAAPAEPSSAPAPAPEHRPGRVRELLDLWAMAFLVLLMPGLHGDPSAAGPDDETRPGLLTGALGSPHGDHVASGADALEVRGVVLLLILVWLAALAWLHLRSHGGERRARLAVAGSAFSAVAMAGMALSG